MERVKIPTYVINLENRVDRRINIEKEFEGREEFELCLTKAIHHEIGPYGLWKTFQQIIKDVIDIEVPYILICEDDHEFTDHYREAVLLESINIADKAGADILLGGVSSVYSILEIKKPVYWVERFSGLQFTIVFRRFFNIFLNCDVPEIIPVDYKISALTNNKFFIFPFISIQKEYGYSDVTPKNNLLGVVSQLFQDTKNTIEYLSERATFYKDIQNLHLSKGYKKNINNIKIPIYVVNLIEFSCSDNIKRQLNSKKEFIIKYVQIIKSENNENSIEDTLKLIVRDAVKTNEDIFVLTDGNFVFTEEYSKDFFINQIIESHYNGSDILLGGVNGGFNYAVPITMNRLWINEFNSTQFVVIYRKFFNVILDELQLTNKLLSLSLSELTCNIMLIYPFITKQFLHECSSESDLLQFSNMSILDRLSMIQKAFCKFKK